MKIEWTKISIPNDKIKIIGDNGIIKIIIGGPKEDGTYWWHLKIEEKGNSTTIEEAIKDALTGVKYEIERTISSSGES